MIIKQLNEIIGTDQEVEPDSKNWASRRLLLAKDGMGFSMHDTIIRADTETHIHYQNHLEAVYCIEGKGEIETVPEGEVIEIKPGTLYALNEHDEHLLRAEKDLRLICVFNPPITGKEVHDENGVYPLIEE